MGLEKLLDEIRSRGESELAAELTRTAKERTAITEERDRKVASVGEGLRSSADREADRIRAQAVAGAKVKSRQLLYRAMETRAEQALERARRELAKFTKSPEYPKVLEAMVDEATDRLGGKVRIRAREEDAALVKAAAGRAFQADPERILGGIVAETADGARRLNLSFDELLRRNADRVRELAGD
ncbi:MAG TPA: V-type ATP synthase subunit E family protein [Thermoplasmata archaeon]|nr:V-type ATP synthase subunit E family protein [Thermoplasmata archaeon]